MTVRRKLALAIATIVVATVAGTAAHMLGPGQENGAAVALDAQPAVLRAAVAQVGPDTSYHLKERTYRRYGPGINDILAIPSTGPEVQFTETTIRFDHNGVEAALDVVVTDEAGKQLQRTTLDQGNLVNTNFGDGKQAAMAGSVQTADEFKAASARATASRTTELAAGHLTTVGRDATTRTVRQELPLPAIRDKSGVELQQGFTIPYVRDLGAVSSYAVATLDAATLSPVQVKIFAVDAAGRETLIEEHDVLSEYAAQEKSN